MKIYSALAAAAMSLVIMDSCTETVEVDAGLDKSRLENTVALTGSFKVLNNPRMRAVEIHEQPVTLQLQATLSNSHDAIAEFIFTAATDDDLVSAYNSAHETDFPGLPVENVKIEDDGLIAIAPGDRLSYEFDMTVSPDGLQQGRTYVLPVRTVSNTPEVKVTDRDTVQYFLFSMQGQRPSAAKESGIVSICYIESGYNPLNAGEWTLATSGKPLFDIVHLFAADIKFDSETGKVYIDLNNNIKAVLENRDKYIKPLQDKGMKVCLTFLPGGDGVGQSNLTDADIHSLAAEIKALINAYGLDGVDFDEEHANYSDNPQPGFEPNGPMPYEKLCYEVKRLLPDKLLTVYYIGSGMNSGFPYDIAGLEPGDFIDYSYWAQYGDWSEAYTTIKGMDRKQWGPHSVGFGPLGADPQDNYLRQLRADGYGVQVVYNLVTKDGNASAGSYQSILGLIANRLYDESVVHSGIDHEVDW